MRKETKDQNMMIWIAITGKFASDVKHTPFAKFESKSDDEILMVGWNKIPTKLPRHIPDVTVGQLQRFVSVYQVTALPLFLMQK
jgi:hypothetical protein